MKKSTYGSHPVEGRTVLPKRTVNCNEQNRKVSLFCVIFLLKLHIYSFFGNQSLICSLYCLYSTLAFCLCLDLMTNILSWLYRAIDG
jgi:uncharacterized membrane protein YkvI